MEMEFLKTEFPYLQTVLRQVQTQEQTQEVRIGDEMPDIGRVLASWGQVLIRSKEWRTGTLGVSGGVMVWVMYAPEDGSAPQSVQAWLPFQMKWDIPEGVPEGNIIATPMLYGVDARSTASRKIMVRTCAGVMAEGVCKAKESLCSPKDLPEDVFLLQNNYPVIVPVETGEKAFLIDEIMPSVSAQGTVARIIHYAVQPEITDQRLLSDKLIFRGRILISGLYADSEGELHCFEGELPVSQYTEVKGEFSENAYATILAAITSLEMEPANDGGFGVKVGLVGQYMIFDCCTIAVTEDAYSPFRKVSAQMGQVDLPVVLDRASEMILADLVLDDGVTEIVDVAFYPEHPRVYKEEMLVTAELTGNFNVLYRDDDGVLRNKVCRWADILEIHAAEGAGISVAITPCSSNSNGLEKKQKLCIDITTVGNVGAHMVEALELGDWEEANPDRPGLILQRRGEGSLWDIAKKYGSSVELIQKMNNLQQDSDSSKMLLIPVL